MKQGERAKVYWVRGRVQGVGFRYFVQRVAQELKLTGHVKNLDDGRVEVYAIGTDDRLAELGRRLWKGPPYSDVRGVDEQEAAVRAAEAFRIES